MVEVAQEQDLLVMLAVWRWSCTLAEHFWQHENILRCTKQRIAWSYVG